MSLSLCRIERVSERTSSQEYFFNEESAARAKPAATPSPGQSRCPEWSHNRVVCCLAISRLFRDRQNSSSRVSRRVALRVTYGFQRLIWEAIFSALRHRRMINAGGNFKLKQYTGAEMSLNF
jgi:hypothetical protein